MNRSKKVLILTCSHGSGHKMVSAALKDAFEQKGCTAVVRDLFNETNREEVREDLLSWILGHLEEQNS